MAWLRLLDKGYRQSLLLGLVFLLIFAWDNRADFSLGLVSSLFRLDLDNLVLVEVFDSWKALNSFRLRFLQSLLCFKFQLWRTLCALVRWRWHRFLNTYQFALVLRILLI